MSEAADGNISNPGFGNSSNGLQIDVAGGFRGYFSAENLQGFPMLVGGHMVQQDAIGARITWSVSGKKFARLKTGGGSYLAAHDPREVLGLGAATKVDYVEIQWPQPSGRVEKLTGVPIDLYVTVAEGKGIQS